MNFLDLCAGIGGFRLGMEQAGNRCVGYVEIDKFARKSYEAMYDTRGEWTAHDITTVTDEEIRAIGRDVKLIGDARGYEIKSSDDSCAHTLCARYYKWMSFKADTSVMDGMRIRRLTPRECWRLQGFSDELFDRARAAGLSDTQLYRQAGNAVTVNVVAAIGRKIWSIDREEK